MWSWDAAEPRNQQLKFEAQAKNCPCGNPAAGGQLGGPGSPVPSRCPTPGAGLLKVTDVGARMPLLSGAGRIHTRPQARFQQLLSWAALGPAQQNGGASLPALAPKMVLCHPQSRTRFRLQLWDTHVLKAFSIQNLTLPCVKHC